MQALAATYYDVLGIGPEATLADIKAAYARQLGAFREKMKTPEKPAAESLDALRQAFTILGDPLSRESYDASLNGAANQSVVQEPQAEPAIPTHTPAATAEPAEPREENFRFTGEGGEYFRIWIVNILLSIVTLGIYSAWAKVRREQYFHRNLMLDGSGFDYHGQPMAILKGRIVAVVLLFGLSAAQRFSPLAYGIAILCLLPLVPWLAVKAFRFRAHNTSYRGLRFSFHGSYGQAFKVFVGYGLLVPFTLWLAFPVFYRQLRKFVLDNIRFGTTAFECAVTTGTIYKIFLLPGLVFIALFVGIVVTAVVAASGKGGKEALVALGFLFMLIPLIFVAVQAVVVPYVTARTNNAVWSSTRLGEHHFRSRLPVGGYIGLTVVNWLATVFTLGLFIPWARVRVARFRAEYLALAVSGSLDDFVAGEAGSATAIGDEAAEMFDLDIGL
ncbi:DUF898 family protein [Dechloromonas denitrificans]|uniref:DUF898 family protein n=1 Tax=Dechloromonas denitrificans TaxID=281362 RepID=UPI001CF91DD6|nr:DUF898 family protein [Dechloromonas denitrificans]UCV05707.1 DUF898 family protein [Dechloromonas denitrificans]